MYYSDRYIERHAERFVALKLAQQVAAPLGLVMRELPRDLPLELPLIFGHISLFAQPTKAGKAKDDYFVQCVKEAAEELGTQYR